MKRLVLVGVMFSIISACAMDEPYRYIPNSDRDYSIENDKNVVILEGNSNVVSEKPGLTHYMDNQQQEMEMSLAKEQANNKIEIWRLSDESLKIDISSEASFDSGRSGLKTEFVPTLQKVTDILRRYPETIIHIIGHTDSVGAESYNMTLSQRRAQSVVNYFSGQGVPQNRLVAVGRGESQPRASNETATGRKLNRRVEIYVKPIIEGQESDAYETPQCS